MIRPLGTALFALGLIACHRESAQETALEPDNVVNATASGPDADINASLEPVAGPPSHSAEPPRFVGRWAASERLCRDTPWRFTESELSTPAGSACRFTDVREVPGGYDIAARCTAEGPEHDDVLKLRFPESAGGMLFESDSIADAGLVRCRD